ncbi:MAG: hypothetical protein JNK72_01425 [Myxococcales bacterium]|nr:hypothetical protein [Myxococcales bacterium]
MSDPTENDRPEESEAAQAETPESRNDSPEAPPTATSAAAAAPDAGVTEEATAEAAPPSPFGAPRRPAGRDWALTLGGLAGLVFLYTRSGHQRWGVLFGLVSTVAAVLGLLGLLGDSPLSLRGDEEAPGPEAEKVWWKREGVWVLLFGAALYLPMAGAYGLWDPWETHYSEVAREILSRDDWITTWWGQEGWFLSKPILIFWMSALGMGFGSLFGLQTHADAGPQWQEWCIRVPISLLAITALFALYRAVSSAWGKRAGVLVAMVLGTMPHWFFLAHQAMTDMPFVAPLTIAISMLMLAVTARDRVATPRAVKVFGRTLRLSLWHGVIGTTLLFSLPQVMYLLTRPMVTRCPEDSRLAQCQDMLAQNRLGSMQFPVETYFYGSANNSADTLANSVPGSPAWERLANVVPFFPSVVQGVLWSVLGALAMWMLRRERRAQDLFFVMFYVWCAVATIGKGPAGLAIPVAVAGAWLVISGRWKLIFRARIFTGLLVFLIVGMPWYIAITGRLGNEFFDRFVVHDIINRTVVGVHGDTGSVRYFILQLGYAMFPWSGLVPVALLGWRQLVPSTASEAQRDVARIGVLWFLVAFVLFSAMITKFHHYIFPAVPGAAVMVGLLLDRMLGSTRLSRSPNAGRSLAALTVGIGALVIGVASFVGSARGLIPRNGTLAGPNVGLGLVLVLAGLAAVVMSWLWAREEALAADTADASSSQADGAAAVAGFDPVARLTAYFTAPDPAPERAVEAARDPLRHGSISHGALAAFAAGVVAFVGRDLAYHGSQRPPGYQRLLQLFTYQYERLWPTESIDYHPIMAGFAVVAIVVSSALVVHALRAHAVRAMVVLGAVFAVWALDFYMIDASRHWSQRGLFERYYAMRRNRSPDETHTNEDARYTADPVGAYMMNWKGENFYTGGRCAMLDCGDLPFCSNHARQWIPNHRGQRLFFVTERTHGSSIVSVAQSAGAQAREVTDAWDNNKFVLVEATWPSN